MTPEFLTHPALPVRHGFFTRRGGISTGPYASLNCSLSGGDDPVCVARNRALVAEALSVQPSHLLGVTQVHGIDVVTVNEPWLAGAGPRADALVTARPGLALGVITADCAPVLFADAAAGVVGAAHAGWRGAVAGVLESTIQAMVKLGAATDRVVAVVGPCIDQSSYEVGEDLWEAIADARFFVAGARPGHWQFDLAGYCVARLGGTGVAFGVDTLSDPERFFSHRRRTLAGGGPIGHQISAVVA